MEQEPEPHIRHAYGALLGDYYEQLFLEHIQLSGAAKVFAPDFERAVEWQKVAVGDSARTLAPNTFQPVLITDEGSAFLDVAAFYRGDPPIGYKIAQFVRAVGAAFAVVSYASSSDRKREMFDITGTNGWTVRNISFCATRRMFGAPIVMPPDDRETAPQESGLLEPTARTLREMHGADAAGRGGA